MSRVWSARPATVRSSQRLRVQTIRANDRFMAERACFGAEASVVFPKCPSICGVVFGLFMRWFLARARKKDSRNAFHEPPGEGAAWVRLPPNPLSNISIRFASGFWRSSFSPQIQGYRRLAPNQIRALNLRGNPAFMVPTHVQILEVSPSHETLPALQNLPDPEISLAKARADNMNIVLWPPWLGSSVGRAED